MSSLKIKVMCVTCKKKKDIDEDEAKRLSDEHRIPMCDDCGMPMVAFSATAKR